MHWKAMSGTEKVALWFRNLLLEADEEVIGKL
jgi:hypothetical protein